MRQLYAYVSNETAQSLFQSEAEFEAFDMKMTFYSHANKINFLKKGFALYLAWKWEFWELEND